LADTAAPVGARQTAFDLLKRTGDTAALPIFVKLLDEPRFRYTAIPLLARSSDGATAEALLQRFPSLSPNDQTAAIATLSTRAALALPMLQAMDRGKIDKKFLSTLYIRQIRNLKDTACDPLLE